MCFYFDDYGWYAAETEEIMIVSAGSKKDLCNDCGHAIPVGQTYSHTDSYEYERCPDCNYRHEEGFECEEENVGESSTFNQCGCCAAFREVIREVEKGRGCPDATAEPQLSLQDEFGGCDDELPEYLDAACVRYPQFAEALRKRWSKTEEAC